ncbi:MAG: thiamine-phosphate pyrophosphorylase [Candidatus Omnitrophota bacterium]
MLKYSHNQGIGRIIDANLNRVKEGLRVCEEITRFILGHRLLTASFKQARHKVDRAARMLQGAGNLLKARDSVSDVGRKNARNELYRRDAADIFRANLQRVKESARVLEEFAKLTDIKAALIFKDLRYRIYEIEKRSFKKIAALSDPGQKGLRKKAAK